MVNTWIFLAEVPRGLRELVDDTSYPRVLKVFAQYILTPLVFIYLLLLLAYMVKIVIGGEWPSGWIGWLVTSVAIAGLLGFLLVHPLRDDPSEAWIRTYTRWLFVGLIPAAIVLLVAFWKRVLPYGLTEMRLLGVLLGLWLLAIAVSYTLRQDAGIKRIPVTLAALLLLTLYGPLSVTSISVASQGRRLARAGRCPAQRSRTRGTDGMAEKPAQPCGSCWSTGRVARSRQLSPASCPAGLGFVTGPATEPRESRRSDSGGRSHLLRIAILVPVRRDYIYLYARQESRHVNPRDTIGWSGSLTTTRLP